MVLDPFCGCATACVSAERLGRQWIGIDISQKAVELVESRLQAAIDEPQAISSRRCGAQDRSAPPHRPGQAAALHHPQGRPLRFTERILRRLWGALPEAQPDGGSHRAAHGGAARITRTTYGCCARLATHRRELAHRWSSCATGYRSDGRFRRGCLAHGGGDRLFEARG